MILVPIVVVPAVDAHGFRRCTSYLASGFVLRRVTNTGSFRRVGLEVWVSVIARSVCRATRFV